MPRIKSVRVSKVGDHGVYEFLSDKTKSLCFDLIALSGLSENRIGKDKYEVYRKKKIEQEIELLQEHKRQCRDFTTKQRMNKTIHYLKLQMVNPDVSFR